MKSDSVLLRDVQRAASRGEIALMYQPIVSHRNSQTPKQETILNSSYYFELTVTKVPDSILRTANVEEMTFLNDWVLQLACQQLHRWHEIYPCYKSLRIGVNLLESQFVQPNLVEKIERVLQATGLKAQSLVLEIDENNLLKDFCYSVSVLEKLYQKGFQVTIDHFGLGYSSLKHLKDLQCHNLKFDHSLIAYAQPFEKHNKLWFLELVTKLAEAFSLQVIVDGMASEEHFKQLLVLKYLHLQGNYISEPMTASDIERLLSQSTPNSI